MDNSKKTHSRFFLDPFSYFPPNQTLIIGLVIIFIAGVINSFANTHFDGIFDIHTGKSSAFIVFITEGYINLIILTGLLFMVGKIFTKQNVNIIDILGQQALARWPLLISSIITVSKPYQRFCAMRSLREFYNFGIFNLNSFDNTIVSFSIIIISIITIWVILLMYKSFSQTYKVQGLKGIIIFIFGALIAEVLSKLLILRII